MILRLRLPSEDAKVHWNSDVVDNEKMNKKKSNKCCIYHKPRPFDESDSESDHSDDEEVKFRKMYPEFAGKRSSHAKQCEHHHSK